MPTAARIVAALVLAVLAAAFRPQLLPWPAAGQDPAAVAQLVVAAATAAAGMPTAASAEKGKFVQWQIVACLFLTNRLDKDNKNL